MPTFQEVEEIKQAHMQSLLQARVKIEQQLQEKAEKKRIAAAELLTSPFPTAQSAPHGQPSSSQGIMLNPFGSFPSTVVVEKSPNASEHSMFFTGGALLTVCALLYVLLKRLWK